MSQDGNCYHYIINNSEKFEEARKMDYKTKEGLELVKITNDSGSKTIWKTDKTIQYYHCTACDCIMDRLFNESCLQCGTSSTIENIEFYSEEQADKYEYIDEVLYL